MQSWRQYITSMHQTIIVWSGDIGMYKLRLVANYVLSTWKNGNHIAKSSRLNTLYFDTIQIPNIEGKVNIQTNRAHFSPSQFKTHTGTCSPPHTQTHGAYTAAARRLAHTQTHGAYTAATRRLAHTQIHGAYTAATRRLAHTQTHGAYTAATRRLAHALFRNSTRE